MPKRQKPERVDIVIRLTVLTKRCSGGDVENRVDDLLDMGNIQDLVEEHVADEYGDGAIEIENAMCKLEATP